MTDLGAEVAALLEKTEQTRNDFLRAEIQTCAIALDMARFEYERGNIPFAGREVESAAKVIAVIERFLPQVRKERQVELRKKLVWLRAALESVRRDFQGKAA
jgi:predicted transcriptional regulator